MKPTGLTNLIVALCAAAMLTACHGRRDAQLQMNVAERLMSTRPDSALAILQRIPPSATRGRATAARYALLKSMALDKNYIDTTTFDVLQPAIDYYARHGSPDEQRRTFYYQGRIYQNRGDDNQAMKSFLNAAEVKGELHDTLRYANLLVAQGLLYFKQYKIAEYIDNNLKAAGLYKAIGRKHYEILSYFHALTGETMLENKHRADSIMSVIEHFAVQNPDETDDNYIVAFISHTVNFGSKEEIEKLLNQLDDTDGLESSTVMDLVNGSVKIGDFERAMKYMERVTIGNTNYDSLKYFAVKAVALDSCGRHKEALENYKAYNIVMQRQHTNLFEHNLNQALSEHQLEISHLTTIREHDRIIYLSISAALTLLLAATFVYHRYRQNRSRRIIAEYEVNAQRLEIEALISEQARLKELLEERNERPAQINEILKSHLDMLNGLLAREITQNNDYAEPYNDWIQTVHNDQKKFMDSMRLAFAASHARLMEHLERHGLTTDEINYICLCAIGLRSKEIGEYIQKRRHYVISHEIRKKLGLDEHETNLGRYIRQMIEEFDR